LLSVPQQPPQRPSAVVVNPDIYNNSRRYQSTLARLERDATILGKNKLNIKRFLDTREANELSPGRVLKYANHLIEVGRVSSKEFEKMTKEDVTEVVLRLKRRNKKTNGCRRKTSC
jgi:hypothetical protein